MRAHAAAFQLFRAQTVKGISYRQGCAFRSCTSAGSVPSPKKCFTHRFAHHTSRGAKKRKLISQLPLENRLIFKGFGLLEVALQQALKGAAVTGFVAGHRCSPHWQAASRPMGILGISRLCGIYLFIFSLSFKSQGCGSLPKNFHRRALLWLMKRVFTS